MEEFKPNPPLSARKKDDVIPAKKVEKVISGTAKSKKKTGLLKAADIFIEDDIASVKDYVIKDVIIPTLKRTIADAINGSINMLFWGENGNGRSRGVSDKVSFRNYSSYSSKRDVRSDSVRTTTGYSYDDIVIDSRGEAEEVLTRMDELVATYGIVSVADFYDLVGVTCNYTDNKYGWTNLRNAKVVPVRDGYMIKLPKAMPLD